MGLVIVPRFLILSGTIRSILLDLPTIYNLYHSSQDDSSNRKELHMRCNENNENKIMAASKGIFEMPSRGRVICL